jgi:hypothetical protein
LKPSASKTKYKQASGEYKCRPEIKLLQYDERFAMFKEFVQYDFEKASQLRPEMKGVFDRIIYDPPFLSEDGQTKGTPCSKATARILLMHISCIDRAMADQVMDT